MPGRLHGAVATGQAADALIGIKWELTTIRTLLEARADEAQPLSVHQNGAARAGMGSAVAVVAIWSKTQQSARRPAARWAPHVMPSLGGGDAARSIPLGQSIGKSGPP
jgi:hypothetical protein